jgi:arylsulfatase A-like enzyme
VDQADSVVIRRHETAWRLLAGEDHGKGGIHRQFHHLIDIPSTLVELTGVPAPGVVDGIGQEPIEGVSMAYTFDKPTRTCRRPTAPALQDDWRAEAVQTTAG